MIKIYEEVDPVVRIPIELREYYDLIDGKLEEIHPVPKELKKEAEDLRESWSVAHDPNTLAEY